LRTEDENHELTWAIDAYADAVWESSDEISRRLIGEREAFDKLVAVIDGMLDRRTLRPPEARDGE